MSVNPTITHVLDTSALLAFYFGESGSAQVRNIIGDERHTIAISVLSVSEFWGRLRAEGCEHAFEADWAKMAELIEHIVPVTLPIVQQGIQLRQNTSARLPYIDALIAATAAYHHAIFVHRDPHFSSIPTPFLTQIVLPEK